MALGKNNRTILHLSKEVSVTGNGAERDVAGPHAVLPWDAYLESVYVSALSCSDATDVKLYAGSAVSGGTAVLSAAVSLTSSALTGTGTISPSKINWSKGQEFCLSENTTNLATFSGLTVILCFRVKGA